VITERVSASVLIEERREHFERQRRGHEERVALQRAEDHVAELLRVWRVLGQLQVLLRARRLRPCRDAAVNPRGAIEHLSRVRDLVRREDVWNV
jgi:hypothetical protein